MGFPNYYEDIVDARFENGAAIVFEFQSPQEPRHPFWRRDELKLFANDQGPTESDAEQGFADAIKADIECSSEKPALTKRRSDSSDPTTTLRHRRIN
jgi:hypothetical protein